MIKKANEFFDEYVKNKSDFSKPKLIMNYGGITNNLIDVGYIVEYATEYAGLNTKTKFQVSFTLDGDFRGMFYIASNLYQDCVRKEIEINREKIESDVWKMLEECMEK